MSFRGFFRAYKGVKFPTASTFLVIWIIWEKEQTNNSTARPIMFEQIVCQNNKKGSNFTGLILCLYLRTIPPFSNIRLEIIALSNVHQLVDFFVSGRKKGLRKMIMLLKLERSIPSTIKFYLAKVTHISYQNESELSSFVRPLPHAARQKCCFALSCDSLFPFTLHKPFCGLNPPAKSQRIKSMDI